MKLMVFILSSLFSVAVFAKVPACMDKKERLEYNENRLLLYRDEMEAKFLARAFVKGIIVGIMEDRQKHVHFEVDLDEDLSTQNDRIEVIYNTKFGELPDNRPGDELIACGDFIVDPYSPFKAVIHWLHISPKKNNHDHGFLAINGQVTGLVDSKAKK